MLGVVVAVVVVMMDGNVAPWTKGDVVFFALDAAFRSSICRRAAIFSPHLLRALLALSTGADLLKPIANPHKSLCQTTSERRDNHHHPTNQILRMVRVAMQLSSKQPGMKTGHRRLWMA